jgi:RNA polymerase sigma factor (sigma-70 family)
MTSTDGATRSTTGLASLSDIELVERARRGDPEPFAELWRRHARAGRTVARGHARSIEADDLVSEAFSAIYTTVLRGGGPSGAFRPYLFTTIRNTAAAWGRARREIPIDDAESIEDPAFDEQNILAALDRALTAAAFRTLPTRWREVLWYSEVERMSPRAIAPLLGVKPNAVSSLANRAREGLRQAWIQTHIARLPSASECRWAAGHLGAYARHGLGKREAARLQEHLRSCARCVILADEARELGSRIALALRPLTTGIAGATRHAA